MCCFVVIPSICSDSTGRVMDKMLENVNNNFPD